MGLAAPRRHTAPPPPPPHTTLVHLAVGVLAVIAADTTVLLLLWPPMVSLPPPALQLLYRLRPSTVSLPPLVHHLVVHLWPSTVSLPPLVHQLVVVVLLGLVPRHSSHFAHHSFWACRGAAQPSNSMVMPRFAAAIFLAFWSFLYCLYFLNSLMQSESESFSGSEYSLPPVRRGAPSTSLGSHA